MITQPESENLLLCLIMEDRQQKAARLKEFTAEDWEDVLRESRRHGLGPLLAWQLKSLSHEISIPGNIQDELRSGLLLSAARNLRLFHELSRVLKKLHEAGIPVIVLKGAFLAEVIYPDLATRPMVDIDIMVQKENLERASQILIEQGYSLTRQVQIDKEIKKIHHLPPLTKPECPDIELHWNIAPPLMDLNIDLEGLWARAQPVTINETSALGLCPEDLLLHLGQHLCQHDFKAGLKPLCDICETVLFYQNQIDWEQLVERARQWKTSKCVYLALYLARELIHTPISPAVLEALQPTDFNAQIDQLAREHVFISNKPLLIHPDLAGLWGDRSLKARLTPFLNSLFPPREFIAQKYQLSTTSKKISWYYFVRLGELFRQYGEQVWQIVRGDENAKAFIRQENALSDWCLSR